MAFIRHYAQQGDPFRFRTMRAGQLVRRHVGIPVHLKRPGSRATLALRRQLAAGGDPFRFKLPKFLKPPKVLRKAVGAIARVALPLAGTFLPGVGGAIAGLLGGGGSPGGSPQVAPELVQQPDYIGTPGEVASRGAEFSDETEYDEQIPDEAEYEPEDEYDDEGEF